MKNFLNKVVGGVMEHVPANLSPENQYSKAFACVLCLVVSADREFDVKEFADSSEFIEGDKHLRDHKLTQRTMTYFNMYCNRIKETMGVDDITFSSVQTDLISEVRECDEPYNTLLKNHIEHLKGGADPIEVAVLNRIAL